MAYTPDRGDIMLLSFDPALGSDQRGFRPAVVISPKSYNRASGLSVVCPITSVRKGYPYEVSVTTHKGINGVALVDQLRCIDWGARSAKKVGTLSSEQLAELLGKLATLTT